MRVQRLGAARQGKAAIHDLACSPEQSVPRAGSAAWKIRAVQLDLARAMESIDTILRYADTAAERGFNTLVLYLEGRVRTATFPFRPAEQSYTLEDMRAVVSHATAAGLDVIPVISTLGHCEQFVRCKEMSHLSEERDGRCRFGQPGASTMCPSLEETYEFFQRYFSELAQVFTGPHWHAGMDECWDLGFCRLCRDRWEQEGLGSLFTRHLLRTHAIVSGLGTRLWRWDDMYELFPERLADVPRDTVMCHWCYDAVIEPEGAQAHFANRWRQDWLRVYEQARLDAVICPSIGAPRNIETFTDYARRHRVLGGLLTQWGGPISAHAGNSTIVAFTGSLWKAKGFDPERAWQNAIRTVVPSAGSALTAAVEALVRTEGCFPIGAIQNYLAGPLYAEEAKRRALLRTALYLLRSERTAHPTHGGADVLDRMDCAARLELLHWDLRELLPRIFDPRRLDADAPWLRQRVAALRKELRAARPNLDQALAPAWQRLARKSRTSDWWLVLRLVLQDVFGSPRLLVTVTAGKERIAVAERGFKPPYTIDMTARHFTVQIPFTSRKVPDGVRLEGWGYGGQGVAFVEAQNPSLTVFPSTLRAVSGPVSRPEAVLRDDSAWAYLGCPDALAAIHAPALAEQRGVLDIGLLPR